MNLHPNARRPLAGLLAVGAAALMFGLASPAQAETPVTAKVACVKVVHSTIANVKLTGAAAATVEAGGLKLTAPVDASAVFSTSVGGNAGVKLADITKLSYDVTKLTGAAPELKLLVEGTAGANASTTLVFKPTVAANAKVTADVTAGTLVSTKAIAGLDAGVVLDLGLHAGLDLAAVVKANPNAKVVGVAISLNAGAEAALGLVNNLKIVIKGKCFIHIWTGPVPTVTQTVVPTPSITVTPTVTTTVVPTMTTAPGDVTPTPVAQSLPVTGSPVPWIVTAGVVLALIGGGLLLFGRRRLNLTK